MAEMANMLKTAMAATMMAPAAVQAIGKTTDAAGAVGDVVSFFFHARLKRYLFIKPPFKTTRTMKDYVARLAHTSGGNCSPSKERGKNKKFKKSKKRPKSSSPSSSSSGSSDSSDSEVLSPGTMRKVKEFVNKRRMDKKKLTKKDTKKDKRKQRTEEPESSVHNHYYNLATPQAPQFVGFNMPPTMRVHPSFNPYN
jgi:hypothetical protein